MIPRFYDVLSGSITIGGVSIKDMSSDYLMSLVSFVFQDVFLFKQSIMDNILVGNPNATKEQVVEAAKAAQCHEFIEKLPNGYNTVIGTKNIHLSGGEKQRIVIARAILKDSPIIVLDEATASLDPENEVEIQQAISELIKGRTVIMIAHKLKTVVSADKIFVLEEGKLVEEGTHADLLKKDGLYAKLYNIQQKSMGWTI